MLIEVNKEKHTSNAETLDLLLEEMNVSPKGIAVAVNNEVISRLNWSATALKENDKVTIIKATQGG